MSRIRSDFAVFAIACAILCACGHQEQPDGAEETGTAKVVERYDDNVQVIYHQANYRVGLTAISSQARTTKGWKIVVESEGKWVAVGTLDEGEWEVCLIENWHSAHQLSIEKAPLPVLVRVDSGAVSLRDDNVTPATGSTLLVMRRRKHGVPNTRTIVPVADMFVMGCNATSPTAPLFVKNSKLHLLDLSGDGISELLVFDSMWQQWRSDLIADDPWPCMAFQEVDNRLQALPDMAPSLRLKYVNGEYRLAPKDHVTDLLSDFSVSVKMQPANNGQDSLLAGVLIRAVYSGCWQWAQDLTVELTSEMAPTSDTTWPSTLLYDIMAKLPQSCLFQDLLGGYPELERVYR